MAEHKFKIGERVYFNSRSRREVPPGPCQIVKRLPAANGEFQYVVRSEYKDHQHVAKEGELSRTGDIEWADAWAGPDLKITCTRCGTKVHRFISIVRWRTSGGHRSACAKIARLLSTNKTPRELLRFSWFLWYFQPVYLFCH